MLIEFFRDKNILQICTIDFLVLSEQECLWQSNSYHPQQFL